MQMINKKTVFLICFALFMVFSVFSANAEVEFPEKVKIGLFYGSRSQNNYTVSAKEGMSFLASDDEENFELFSDETLNSVVVEKNSYYSTETEDIFDEYEDAKAKVQEFKEQDIDAYCHYDGENFIVRIGLFNTIEDAQASAEVLGTTTTEKSTTAVLVFSGEEVLISVDDENRYLEISPLSDFLAINSVSYRGNLRFSRQKNSDMTAINVLPFEEYLYAVLPKEVSPSWNEEALKAQAVTARTFTLMNLNKFADYGFNLDNTTTSQVYGGVNVEHPRTTQAVNDTRGEIITYNSKPASVYYFSSSGGKTSNSEDVWTAALPYLRSVEDTYENPKEASYSSWTVSFTKGRIKDALAKQNVHIGDILDVSVEYSESGRAINLIFTGTEGKKEYKKDSIRTPLGLRSTNFIIKKGDVPSSYMAVSQGNKRVAVDLNKNISILTKDGVTTLDKTAPCLLSSEGISTPILSAPTSDEYTFVGGGWGHGVGMSQWGAKGMADNGFDYIEILTHYFTGVQVETY